jgi:aminoglycoside phosphotransferase (APT) family kinase protein
VFGDYDRGEKAVREYRTLEHMAREGIPVPHPLLLDETGDLLGSPGIVTAFVPGLHIDRPEDPESWADELGKVLARLHAVRIDEATRGILLDANAEVTWFIRGETVPDFMAAHPEGPRVWELVRTRYPGRVKVSPGPVHVDYWSGNILWDAGRISAVVDWEEAAWGDPEIDLAYLRMDMVLSGMGPAWEIVLAAYERALGRPAENVAFWELVAAGRPMFSPGGWISVSPAIERFKAFIDNAESRL